MYNKHTFVVCLCKGGGGEILLFSCGFEFFCKCPISEVDFNKSIFGLLSFLPWERAKSAVKLLRRLLLVLNSSKREPRSKDVKEPLWLNLIIRLNLSALNILSFSEASYSCSSWWSFSSSSSSSSALFPEKLNFKDFISIQNSNYANVWESAAAHTMSYPVQRNNEL